MKKQFVFVLLVSISYLGFGQHVYPTKFDDCNVSGFFLEGKEVNVEYDNEKLLNELIKTIDTKTLGKIKGSISFQVVVDTLGNHCCISLKDDLNSKGRKVNFKEIIDTETSWGIPMRKGHKANVSVMIKIEFEKNKIIISRLGFNGKTGWMELSRYEMKR